MSLIQNDVWKESAREDFDTFLAKGQWVNAQAIVDSFSENGFEHESVILRKSLLRAQFEWLEGQSREEENTAYETGKYQDVRDLNIY